MVNPGAANFFSQFMEGYTRSSALASQERMQKAQNLMQFAAQQAKLVDEAQTTEGAAAAWENAQNTMKEAEKLMKPGKSGFSQILGLFGKKNKGELTDPRHLVSGLIGGGEGGPAPMPRPSGLGPETAPAPNPQQEQAAPSQGLPAPPDAQGNNASQLEDVANIPGASSSPYADQKLRPDGVPENPQFAPASVGGPAGAKVEPQREVPPPPFSAVNPLAQVNQGHEVGATTWFPTAEDVGFANKYGAPLDVGQVVKEKATGKGLELVRVGSGETQYWVNGRPITKGQFDKYSDLITTEGFKAGFRKGESAEKIAEQTKIWETQHKLENTDRNSRADEWVKWSTQKGMNPEKVKRIETEIRFGLPHEQAATVKTRQQDENGDVYEISIDRETGEVYPFTKVKVADTQQVMDIKAILNDPKQWGPGEKPTLAKATEKYYQDRSNDNEAKDLARRLANQNATIRLQSNKQLMDIRTKAATGKLEKKDIQDALKYVHQEAHDAAMETDQLTGERKFVKSKYDDALYSLLVGTLGVPWERIYSAYGGDPRVAAQASQNDADKAARELSGGEPAYRPSR